MSTTVDYFEVRVKCPTCGHEWDVDVVKKEVDTHIGEIHYSPVEVDCPECDNEVDVSF